MEYSTDLKAFNQLFADYQGRFIRFANMYVRDMAVAEDFTIEALMQYWENRNTLKADSNVPAYILTIIKNKCINYLQQTRRIFIMSRYENKPYKEIAETLGMTTKGVEYHITQALKKLHINLKDYIPLFAFLSYMS